MTVEEVIRQWERHGTDRRSGFSSHSYSEPRSRIIETLLIGMPQRPLFIDDTEYEWTVIDGEERVKAFHDFCSGRLKLTSLYFKMNQYEGKTIDDLSVLARKNILNTEIAVNVLNPGLSRQERFGIYACLKPRLDSDTLSACRKKIFSPNYEDVVNLAKAIHRELNIFSRTTVLENEICHLLVAIDNKPSGYHDGRYHIDVAANAILEREDFSSFFCQNAQRIEETLRKTLRRGRNMIFFTYKQGKDYLNALTFIKGDVDEQWLNEELTRMIRDKRMQGNVNSVEQFYNTLQFLLEIKK